MTRMIAHKIFACAETLGDIQVLDLVKYQMNKMSKESKCSESLLSCVAIMRSMEFSHTA